MDALVQWQSGIVPESKHLTMTILSPLALIGMYSQMLVVVILRIRIFLVVHSLVVYKFAHL